MFRYSLLILLIMILPLTGCDRVEYVTDDQYSYLTLTLTEPEVADLIVSLLTGGTTPVMRTARVDLRAGQIYVEGEINDGRGGTFPGNLTMRLWSVDGGLQASVNQLNFAGYTVDPATLNRINRDIAAGFASATAQNTSNSTITDVVISDSNLRFTIRSPLDNAR